VGTLRKLRRVMEELEDSGVDPEDIVVDPKAVHVVVSDEVEEAESNPEEE
jgi:hypothetical protein